MSPLVMVKVILSVLMNSASVASLSKSFSLKYTFLGWSRGPSIYGKQLLKVADTFSLLLNQFSSSEIQWPVYP